MTQPTVKTTAPPKAQEPYGLAPEFERAVVWLACSRPRFYGTIGAYLDPTLLGLPAGQVAFEAAKAIFTDTGNGPDAWMLVVQRLRRWEGEGKVTRAQIQEVYALLEEVEDAAQRPSEEAVIAEIAPVLKRRKQAEVMTTAFDEFAKKGDFSRVIGMVQMADRIGVVNDSLGTLLGNAAFDNILRSKRIQKLPTGIPELDQLLQGGMHIGCEGVFLADSGGGKSMALGHVAASGVMLSQDVAYATLELPEDIIQARLFAHVTNVPIDSIMYTEDGLLLAKDRWAQVAPGYGSCVVKSFTPQATKVEDIKDWVRRHEQEIGRPVTLIVVDYGDKLVAPKTKDDSTYTTGRVVYEGLRIWAEEEKKWMWTASQATRKSAGKTRKRLDIDDVADSMHKVRVADLVVSINPDLDENGAVSMLSYYIAKNRLGQGRLGTLPLPHEWEFGRASPISTCKF